MFTHVKQSTRRTTTPWCPQTSLFVLVVRLHHLRCKTVLRVQLMGGTSIQSTRRYSLEFTNLVVCASLSPAYLVYATKLIPGQIIWLDIPYTSNVQSSWQVPSFTKATPAELGSLPRVLPNGSHLFLAQVFNESHASHLWYLDKTSWNLGFSLRDTRHMYCSINS